MSICKKWHNFKIPIKQLKDWATIETDVKVAAFVSTETKLIENDC